ncbi:acid-sensing ion channel 2 isoform X1 [Ciona intestinalis]
MMIQPNDNERFVTSRSAPHSMLSYASGNRYSETGMSEARHNNRYSLTMSTHPESVELSPIDKKPNTNDLRNEHVVDDMPNTRKEENEQRPLKPSDFVFFASNSTFHGISHIFTDGKFTLRRALWAVAFFSSLSLFLVQAYDRFIYYRSHPHVTKLDEEEASEIDFPALTICNMNSFRLSAITTDDYYYAGQYMFDIFDNQYNLKPSGYRDNKTWPYVLDKIRPILEQNNDYQPTKQDFSMFEFYNRTGYKVEGMVKMCKYRGINCTNMNDWSEVYTRYGKCYTFNSGVKQPPLKTLKGGVDNGLELLLDTQQNEYMPVWKETDEITIEAGFKVQIHVQSEPPFIHELGFGISPGFQTLVSTQEQRITFLPNPWGKCRNGFDKSEHYHFPNYSISACRISCETLYVYLHCNCRMIHMPGKERYCTPEEYKTCADKALDFLVMTDDQLCVCETPCEVIRYNLEMSTLQLPSTQASSYLAYKYQVSEDYVRKNFAKLNIFFEALNYETIEQKVAYEIPGLFGDIGGQMGLFIGASILTILELVDYFYEVVKDRTWGRKLRKNTDRSPTREEVNNKTVSESGSGDMNNGFTMPIMQYTAPQVTSREDTLACNEKPSSLSTCGHLTPLQEFQTTSCSNEPTSRPGFRTQPGDFRSLPPPPSQYLGNSLMTLRENKNEGGRFENAPNNVTRRLAPRGGREASMSYNDIYRAPEEGWPNGGSGSDAAPTLRYTANRCGNSTRETPPPTYKSMAPVTQPSRPSNFYPISGDKQNAMGSPTRPLPNLREFPASIETDIH